MKYLRIVLLLASIAILAVTLVPTIVYCFQPDSLVVNPPPVPDNIKLILGYILFGLSEVIAWVPWLKSNSVVQLIFSIVTSIVKKLITPNTNAK